MRLLDAIVEASHRAGPGGQVPELNAGDFAGALPLIALTCVDPRLNNLLPGALGITRENFIWLRNAGNIITGPLSSTMRSLALACAVKTGREIVILGHTDCRICQTSMLALLDRFQQLGVTRAQLPDDLTGFFGLFASEHQNVMKAVEMARASPLIGPKVPVHGLSINTATGKLDWVVNGYQQLEAATSASCPSVPQTSQTTGEPVKPTADGSTEPMFATNTPDQEMPAARHPPSPAPPLREPPKIFTKSAMVARAIKMRRSGGGSLQLWMAVGLFFYFALGTTLLHAAVKPPPKMAIVNTAPSQTTMEQAIATAVAVLGKEPGVQILERQEIDRLLSEQGLSRKALAADEIQPKFAGVNLFAVCDALSANHYEIRVFECPAGVLLIQETLSKDLNAVELGDRLVKALKIALQKCSAGKIAVAIQAINGSASDGRLDPPAAELDGLLGKAFESLPSVRVVEGSPHGLFNDGRVLTPDILADGPGADVRVMGVLSKDGEKFSFMGQAALDHGGLVGFAAEGATLAEVARAAAQKLIQQLDDPGPVPKSLKWESAAFLQTAQRRFHARQYLAAARSCQAALALDPSNTEAVALLGSFLMDLAVQPDELKSSGAPMADLFTERLKLYLAGLRIEAAWRANGQTDAVAMSSADGFNGLYNGTAKAREFKQSWNGKLTPDQQKLAAECRALIFREYTRNFRRWREEKNPAKVLAGSLNDQCKVMTSIYDLRFGISPGFQQSLDLLREASLTIRHFSDLYRANPNVRGCRENAYEHHAGFLFWAIRVFLQTGDGSRLCGNAQEAAQARQFLSDYIKHGDATDQLIGQIHLILFDLQNDLAEPSPKIRRQRCLAQLEQTRDACLDRLPTHTSREERPLDPAAFAPLKGWLFASANAFLPQGSRIPSDLVEPVWRSVLVRRITDANLAQALAHNLGCLDALPESFVVLVDQMIENLKPSKHPLAPTIRKAMTEAISKGRSAKPSDPR